MKRLYILLLCLVVISAKAQQLTHSFQNASLSEALIWIDNAQENYKLNFIFDELEDFTVTTRLENVSVRDAVRQVCGFYPMNLVFDHQDIFIECTQKEDAKVIGRVIDEAGHPIVYCGLSNNGGHAFNVDGYTVSTNKYHINWGWSGSGNGDFALNAFTDSEGDTYNQYQSMVIGIQPPGGVVTFPVLNVDPTSLDFGTINSGQTVSKTFTVTGINILGDITISCNSAAYQVSHSLQLRLRLALLSL